MGRSRIPDSELMLDVDAYYEYGGNKTEAAKHRKMKPDTYAKRLKLAERTLHIKLNKAADGRIDVVESIARSLPRKGQVKRYILTSAQNNTHLHPGFDNLLAYAQWLEELKGSSCELLIGTYSYQMNAYGPKAVKRGRYDVNKVKEELWYDKRMEPYICDESVCLAPGLIWCGEQNILPTALNPLHSFDEYNGIKSNVVPHSKIAMESVPTMSGEYTKFNYSTGTITQRNYIQKRIGILAERKHTYGALLVEVDSNGNWWARQLHLDDDGDIMDIGPSGFTGVHIRKGKVKATKVTQTIYWGDVHAWEMDDWVLSMAWGKGGMLDVLKPNSQYLGDVFSMTTRGHHEIKNFHSTYYKHVNNAGSVEDEVNLTANMLTQASRNWCNTRIVSSNHDRHLERWLNEADFRTDPLNAKYFVLLQYQVLDAMDRGDHTFNILEWALRRASIPKKVEFLPAEESCVEVGVEHGLHGDLGPNGSRGSTTNLRKLGRPINKGHDHKATINGNVYSSGSCATAFSYASGPQSKSVSHIVTYKNGKRCIVTMSFNKWRA